MERTPRWFKDMGLLALLVLVMYVVIRVYFTDEEPDPGPPMYQAKVTILVESTAANGGMPPTPTAEELETYVALAESDRVLAAAIEMGEFPVSVEELDRALRVQAVPVASLIILTVLHSDPELAAEMANQVSELFFLYSADVLQQNNHALEVVEEARVPTSPLGN